MYKNKLKEIRKKENLSQNKLAEYLGIHRARYCQYETEKDIIPINHINKIATFFNTSLDYLFEFNPSINYPNSKNKINSKLSGKRLKELRKENKLTQNKLAQILNTANTTISGYERGARIIATPFLYEICKKYNFSADYLLGKTDYPKYLN